VPILDEKEQVIAWFGAASDITARKQAEERLRLAIAGSDLGTWHWDIRTGSLDWSERCLEIFGFPPHTAMSYEKFLGALHPEDRTRADDAVQGALQDRSEYRMEFRTVWPDGSLHWAVSIGRAYYDDAGEPTCMEGIALDITERKCAEAAQRLTNERLTLAVKCSQVVLFQQDLKLRYTWLHNPAPSIDGSDAVGKRDEDVVERAEDAAVIVGLKREVIRSGLSQQHEFFTQVQGVVHCFEVLMEPLRDAAGLIIGITGAAIDITERKRAEEALARMAAIVESSHDALFSEDIDGIITSWNHGAEQIFGYRAEEIVGTSILRLIPEARQDEEHELQRELAAGERGGTLEAIRQRKDGTEFHVSLTISPLQDAGGKFIGTARVVRDITERKQAERALRTSEQRFRTLFESMDEGFCVIEMAFDEGGRARDYRVLEMNPAFDKHTGMNALLGRWVREAIPDLEEFWYETYGRVAATGEPTRFVRETAIRGGRWLDVYAFRLGAAGSNKVAILFNDITASRRAEETVRASEARNSFLVTLTDTLRPLSDPINAQAEASRVLGERLGANRVYYYEVGSDDYVIEQDYTNAALSMVGRYPISSFGPNPLAALRAGRTASEADVSAMPARTPEEKAVFAGLQIRSYISVPLVKSGTFVAGLAVHADRVREWTPTEIAITEDTAERTWAAIERVRVEAALQSSEENMRRIFKQSPAGIVQTDAHGNMVVVNDRWCEMLGFSRAELLGRNVADVTDASSLEMTV